MYNNVVDSVVNVVGMCPKVLTQPAPVRLVVVRTRAVSLNSAPM